MWASILFSKSFKSWMTSFTIDGTGDTQPHPCHSSNVMVPPQPVSFIWPSLGEEREAEFMIELWRLLGRNSLWVLAENSRDGENWNVNVKTLMLPLFSMVFCWVFSGFFFFSSLFIFNLGFGSRPKNLRPWIWKGESGVIEILAAQSNFKIQSFIFNELNFKYILSRKYSKFIFLFQDK